MRPNTLKTLWRQNRTAVNAWLTVPSAWTAEVMANAGYDSVTIDMQHGLIGYETALSMLQAISTTGTVPMVRLLWNDPATIMRVLDAGAYGVIAPLINTRADSEAFVAACRYPPHGFRSYGPTRAAVYAGVSDYIGASNETVATLIMVETAACVENLEDIACTPGLDGLYVGPWDLSLSLGSRLGDFTDPVLARALDRVLDVAARYNLVPGVHSGTPENSMMLAERGFRLVTPAADTNILAAGAAAALAQTRAALG